MIDTAWQSMTDSDFAVPTQDGQVALFAMDVEGLTSDAGDTSCLHVDEIKRSERLIRAVDRHRFIQSRLMLRRVLSRYGMDPVDIFFQYNQYGKPYTDIQCNGQLVHFNLSHSGRWVLLGVSLGASIGVDIEVVNNALDMESIASRYFHPDEVLGMQALSSSADKCQLFYRLWVCKEAKAKALGVGLPRILGENCLVNGINLASFLSAPVLSDGDGFIHFINTFKGYHASCYYFGSKIRMLKSFLIDQ